MEKYEFLDKDGTFELKNPENYSGLYFPIAGEAGIKSSITPVLGGDCKIDQNQFVLEPVSVENLHNNRNTRNFWCHMESGESWSACGSSAKAITERLTDKKEESSLKAGFMWQTLTRTSNKIGLQSKITSFTMVENNVEVMNVVLTNITEKNVSFTPTAAIPVFGRSADNIRDHRHVTSLLHRIETIPNGVIVTPTLSFDERGHKRNKVSYFVVGTDDTNKKPASIFPTVESFIGEGGNLEWPEAVLLDKDGTSAGEDIEGMEAMGGLKFEKATLKAGESKSYTILLGATEEKTEPNKLLDKFSGQEKTEKQLAKVQKYWKEKVNVTYNTKDEAFNQFMHWVSFQPTLRRVYGCSFLPHHDYGKGGRGWRDLWQDCLALLIMNPDGVKQMLLDNFQGVRMDGTNATIIGSKPGEFVADRNNITRVWMDHGVWPFMTTKLYIDQTGDLEILDEKVTYFKDKQIGRGTKTDTKWNENYGTLQKEDGVAVYKGTVLEHLLLQNLTAFYDVGEHNHMLLRGADWNDALDMAPDRGESVAFTNAYEANLRELGNILMLYADKKQRRTIEVSNGLVLLLEDGDGLYNSVFRKREVLKSYLETCEHDVSGVKVEISTRKLAENLLGKAEFIKHHIQETEWIEDGKDGGWFNGYYDNHGRAVEGFFDKQVRMMLTSQVFSVMAGTADEQQIEKIVKSADKYLYVKEVGGYRLNTNFNELKMDMGRMFGFAYGEKENGAVFSHMAVMYANALYSQGFAKAGYKALSSLANQALNFEKSYIYPGIPEYFNSRGRGLYHYLTGAASWYMLTAVTEMFGVKGSLGDLVVEPKLMAEQFHEDGMASIDLCFGKKNWNVIFINKAGKDYPDYSITSAKWNDIVLPLTAGSKKIIIPKEVIMAVKDEKTQQLIIELA